MLRIKKRSKIHWKNERTACCSRSCSLLCIKLYIYIAHEYMNNGKTRIKWQYAQKRNATKCYELI